MNKQKDELVRFLFTLFVGTVMLAFFFVWSDSISGSRVQARVSEPPASVNQLPRPRFELLLKEEHDGNGPHDGTDFYVYHDRESGQEIVCPYTGWGVSCYPTGRKW